MSPSWFNQKTITVRVKVAGFVDRKMITAEFDLAVPEATTIKKLFKLIDKSGQIKGKVMKKIQAMPRPPTLLLNGESADFFEDADRELSPGDEVSIMTPMAGG